jgi:hypothetical protein
MKKILILCIAFACYAFTTQAQDTVAKANYLTISGYAEIYYGFDFNRPADNTRPGFVYSHNRHNEVNLNLGFIKATYNNGLVRGNLALMAGTYANANLAAEQGVLKNVYEANIGIKLAKNANLWVDGGVFGSHIGFESAISKDCWTLTRNIVSDNTPYYESGAKVSYTTADNKLTLVGLYLNGWQRINRQNYNSKPAGGVQIYYKPTDRITLNYSNYLGTEGADSISVQRFYHNFYAIFQVTPAFGVTAGIDYGTQQKAKGSNVNYNIFAPVAIARFQISPKWAAAGRAEYYRDSNGIFISTNTPHGFETTGYSLNLDYAPVPNALIRLEGKMLNSTDKVFSRQAVAVNNNALITASFAVSF